MRSFHEQYKLTLTHRYVYEDGSVSNINEPVVIRCFVSDNQNVEREQILNEMIDKLKEFVNAGDFLKLRIGENYVKL